MYIGHSHNTHEHWRWKGLPGPLGTHFVILQPCKALEWGTKCPWGLGHCLEMGIFSRPVYIYAGGKLFPPVVNIEGVGLPAFTHTCALELKLDSLLAYIISWPVSGPPLLAAALKYPQNLFLQATENSRVAYKWVEGYNRFSWAPSFFTPIKMTCLS